jgi:hypothetical protein
MMLVLIGMGSSVDKTKLFGAAGIISALAFIVLLVAAISCAGDWTFGVDKISDLALISGSSAIYMAALVASGALAAVLGLGALLSTKEPLGKLAGLLVVLAAVVLIVLAFMPAVGDARTNMTYAFAAIAVAAILVSAIADYVDKMYITAILSAAFAVASVVLFLTMTDYLIFAVVVALWVLLQGILCFAPTVDELKYPKKDLKKAKSKEALKSEREAKAEKEKAARKEKAEKEKAEKEKAEKEKAEKEKAEKDKTAAAAAAVGKKPKKEAEAKTSAKPSPAAAKAEASPAKAAPATEEKPARRPKVAFVEVPTPVSAIHKEEPAPVVVSEAPKAKPIPEPVAVPMVAEEPVKEPVEEPAVAAALAEEPVEEIVEEPMMEAVPAEDVGATATDAVEEPSVAAIPEEEPVEETVEEPVAEEVPSDADVGATATDAVEEPSEDISDDGIGDDEYTDNSPEALVRRAAWNKGLRCRRGYGPYEIPVAVVKGRVAVFVQPADADASLDETLRSEGWTVFRYDEAEITDGLEQGETIAAAVKENLRAARASAKKKKK